MTRTPVAEPEIGPIVWHDLECGAYAADLELWAELAERSATQANACNVLDLGCGTGRVALSLGTLGHRITGLDLDPVLAGELRRRAAEHNVRAGAVTGDVRDFHLGRRFDLVLAVMQLVQLLPGRDQRMEMFANVREHLRPGGLFAAALLDLSGEPTDGDYTPPLPDMCELDGWVWSSQAVEVRILDAGAAIALDRRRRAVSPEGRVAASESSVRLEMIMPQQLEVELAEAGLEPVELRPIAPTEDHVGSVVVIAEKPRG
jgi:SAM-dependent methyltransferase